MRNALVAATMLLAGAATVASAQDTTRAGQQDTTIRREGQQAQADSAWRQGDKADSARLYGRDSLPQGEQKAQGEQDAVNPKLDAQGRPDSAHADSSQNPTSASSSLSSSIQTMEPTTGSTTTGSTGGATTPGATTPNQELSAADRPSSTLSAEEWFGELREEAKDQQISRDPQAIPGQGGASGQANAEPGQQSQVQEQSQAPGSVVEQDAGATTGTSSSTTGSASGSDTNDSPGEQTATSQPERRKSPDSESGRPEVRSSTTTGQQQNAANAPGNRDGTATTSPK